MPFWLQLYPVPTNTSVGYLNSLANCTYQLVQQVCTQDTCPDVDPSTDIVTQCSAANVDAGSFLSSQADPCGAILPPDWTLGLHVAAVFVVLIASSIGACVPLLAKYHPGFDIDPYWIMLGKCMGIGVVLSCGLVHMLQPASESLTSPCLPWEFNTDYNAYAFLYCVLAILAMHFIDFSMEKYLMAKWAGVPASQQPPTHRDEIAMVKLGEAETAVAQIKVPADLPIDPDDKKDHHHHVEEGGEDITKEHTDLPSPGSSPPQSPSTGAYKNLTSPMSLTHTSSATNLDYRVGKQLASLTTAGHDGHVHSILLAAGVKRTISAYLLEFGVTVHSVFIGLANGIDGDDQLHVLLVALVFHQMFEGIALGARIADANFPTHWHEVFLTMLFSVAAPFGIAIGIGVKTGLNPNGETFLMVQGTFDAICSGILIYIGLVLLLRDFPEDMQRFCKGDWRRMAGMFVFLYIGAGLMSFIGKYL